LFIDAASLSGVRTDLLHLREIYRNVSEYESFAKQRETVSLDFAAEKHIVGNSLFLSAACSEVSLLYIFSAMDDSIRFAPS
jgi:hypothetical protein